jgi:hypothetical protein
MSLTVFIAVCVLGADFLIYVFFQWTYGDKRREMARRLEAHRNGMKGYPSKPFVVSSRKAGSETQARIQMVRERMTKRKPKVVRTGGPYNERMA